MHACIFITRDYRLTPWGNILSLQRYILCIMSYHINSIHSYSFIHIVLNTLKASQLCNLNAVINLKNILWKFVDQSQFSILGHISHFCVMNDGGFIQMITTNSINSTPGFHSTVTLPKTKTSEMTITQKGPKLKKLFITGNTLLNDLRWQKSNNAFVFWNDYDKIKYW